MLFTIGAMSNRPVLQRAAEVATIVGVVVSIVFFAVEQSQRHGKSSPSSGDSWLDRVGGAVAGAARWVAEPAETVLGLLSWALLVPIALAAWYAWRRHEAHFYRWPMVVATVPAVVLLGLAAWGVGRAWSMWASPAPVALGALVFAWGARRGHRSGKAQIDSRLLQAVVANVAKDRATRPPRSR